MDENAESTPDCPNSPATRAVLEMRLFGPMEIWLHSEPLSRLRSRREPLLLALLALHAGRDLERQWLANVLWPGSSDTAALANLRNSLKDIRRAIGSEAAPRGWPGDENRDVLPFGGSSLIQPSRGGPRTLRLSPNDVACDVAAFDALIARADTEALNQAVALYRGPLLDGYHDAWVIEERRRREHAYLEARESLAQQALMAGESVTAERHLRHAIAVDPLRESLYRELMRALVASGSYAAALQCYRDLRLLLHRELNVDPDPETQSLFRRLQEEMRHRSAPASEFPGGKGMATTVRPPVAGETSPRSLPSPFTRFIGRERELAELRRLLNTTRLLTITGAGGCGKSRLALEAARERLDSTPDGVWLIELASLADGAMLPQVVAAALGLRELPGEPLIQTLAGAIRSKRLLLLLDNCERLLDACAALAKALLSACPEAQILATSREGLNVVGETLFRIPPLPFPERELPPSRWAEFRQYESVILFVERAAAVAPSFDLTEQNAPAVANICRRLDGIPLAIELAAAGVRSVPVEEIQRRLDDRFRSVASGPRTAPPRHRTLRASLDWSYALLSDAERALLRRLSVFAGGWTLNAVERVAVLSGSLVIRQDEVLERLSALVDKSLVQYEERGGEGRYWLLETVRQYGGERLLEADEGTPVRRAHRDYFLALAERAEPELRGADQARWLERLDREHDNLRAALDESKARGEIEEGLRLSVALEWFWKVRGFFTEGRERTEALLGADASATLKGLHLRGRALFVAGSLACLQGEWSTAQLQLEASRDIGKSLEDTRLIAWSLRALGLVALTHGGHRSQRPLLEEGIRLAREVGDQDLVRQYLSDLGFNASFRGEWSAARACFEDSLALARELGHTAAVAFELMKLGEIAYHESDLVAARARLEESLALSRQAGVQRYIAMALQRLGRLVRVEGDVAEAQAWLEEALSLSRALGERQEIGICLRALGEVAQTRGEADAARAYYGESLSLFRTMGHRWGIAFGIDRLASLAANGDAERAARLFGAAAALREALEFFASPVESPEIERAQAIARDALGETAFASVWADGRAMPLPDAIEYALTRGPE